MNCPLDHDEDLKSGCHSEAGDNRPKNPTVESRFVEVNGIYGAVGSGGIPARSIRAFYSRTVPRAGFAAAQDDVCF